MKAACVNFADDVRDGYVLAMCNLLQPVPKRIFETHARFVSVDDDGSLSDERFHECASDGSFQPNWRLARTQFAGLRLRERLQI